MKTTIVTTTINLPTLVLKYAQNARRYGHKDVDFIVIGDRKTPPQAAAVCRSVQEYYPCNYMDIPAQQKYMDRFPDLWHHLRFDCIQRRNIGMLLAWENGADIVITIDDDNFVLDQDFVGLHSAAGSLRKLPTYSSTSGWFNVCSLLKADHDVQFYHRGYPQDMRWNEGGHFVTMSCAERKIAVNAGFWLDNPDIDAVTRMERQPVVRGFKDGWSGNIVLSPGTWSPFNSQNTALAREALPAYFLSPYVGRYDDIWAGYILERIAEHLGEVISYGEPLVRQERNPHDLWRDIDAERNGMILTSGFCAALRGLNLGRENYHECFHEIIVGLRQNWLPEPGWADSQKEWRSKLLEGMEIWHGVFSKLTVGTKPEKALKRHDARPVELGV